MPPKTKNILLVDDHPIVLEGLRAILTHAEDLQLIGHCPSAESAYTFLRNHAPDLIIMDISMKDLNGLAATKRITATHPRIPILILTCNDETLCASMAAAVGAKGLVMKDQPDEEILRAIRTVLQGGHYHSPRLAKTRNSALSAPALSPPPAHLDKLSKRELEILSYLAGGFTTTRMALALKVSLKTIETHRLNIRTKLGFDNQTDLVRWAIYCCSRGFTGKSRLPADPAPPRVKG